MLENPNFHPMRLLLLSFLGFALQGQAQTMEDLKFIQEVNHQGDKETVYSMTSVPNLAIQITYMGTLCVIRVNPIPVTGGEDLSVMALGSEYYVWKTGISDPTSVSVHAPITFWSDVKQFSCVCPQGQSATISLYEVKQ